MQNKTKRLKSATDVVYKFSLEELDWLQAEQMVKQQRICIG